MVGERHMGEETLEKHGSVWRVYRCGMLVYIVACLAGSVYFVLMIPPEYGGNRHILVLPSVTLLFFHLACFFRWPRRVSIALWTLASSSVALTWFYVIRLLWAEVLHP
jgi:hypothetical protein